MVYPSPKTLTNSPGRLSGVVAWQDSLLFVWSEHFTFLFNPKIGNWQPIKLKEKNAKNDGTRFWQGYGTTLMSRVKAADGLSGRSAVQTNTNPFKPVSPSKYTPLLHAFYWGGANAFDYNLVHTDTLYQLDKSGRVKTTTLLDNICKDCSNISFQISSAARFYFWNIVCFIVWIKLKTGSFRMLPIVS